MPNGQKAFGYRAELLPQVCEVYLEARDAGALVPSQIHIARQAELLVRSLAKVGIVALVDEATGYQRDRGHDALRLLLEKYIVEGLQKWIHTFPDSFFAQLGHHMSTAIVAPSTLPIEIAKAPNRSLFEIRFRIDSRADGLSRRQLLCLCLLPTLPH